MRLEHVQFQLFSIMVLHINAIGITFVVMKVNAEIMDLLLRLVMRIISSQHYAE